MAHQQLSLFDSLSGGEGTIRPGDRVKLRKKSASAPYTKKGDTFQVDMVHPGNGSVRIWNPNTEEWGFLYPGEFKLVPTPVDSVTPEPVTESIPPDDSVTPEPVTESIPPDDSVTKSISRYRPKGTARGGEYFRFSYRSGNKVRHVHVPGGNTDSAIANARCEEIREAIALGVSSEAIAQCLRDRSAIVLF
ncbi:hypothetical protein QUB63_16980 [Microcoleus sp. ARI1-B5]|uniref:hypothetical protein n=1 Tax=unclassified Microcoleus TaxID=2642155 RepID=UPI002FD6AF59